MRTILTLFAMLYFFSLAHTQTINKEYILVVGTYTNPDRSNGIHVYRFNAETGDFTALAKVVGITNPSYLVAGKDGKHLYAVSEVGMGNGTVNAFSFNPASGKLSFINSVSSGGDAPCYVAIDDKMKYIFVGNYGAGTLSAIRINSDGSLNPDIQTIAHQGSSVNKSRQEKPHVHAVVLSPDNHFLFTVDLGTDKINIYRFDPASARPLSPANPAFVPVKAGSGPRHFTFHPNEKFAYLIQVIEGMVTVFNYKKGELEAIQSITMLAADFTGNTGAADIHVSPDGKFLYTSNRGDANDIVIYAIGKKGRLTYSGRQSTLGKTPRNFAIDPTGHFLIAANQDSNDIVIFRRDKSTGLLSNTGKKIIVDKPVCLKFTTIE